MKPDKIKLLQDLIKIPSPSGFEDNLANFIKKHLSQYIKESNITVDSKNNVVVELKGRWAKKTIMIDAHLDEIGFIVNNINKDGLISLKYIGGGDNSILSARELQILTEKGIINAVVNRKHSHLIVNEVDVMIEDISEAEVDVGIRKKGLVSKYIGIGDPVVYKPLFEKLLKDYYYGYGFDNKAGVFMLLELIRTLVKSKGKGRYNYIFTFSSQEELGHSQLVPIIRKYKPDIFITVDVTFASDYLESENLEKEVGYCELERGVVLYRGVDIDKKCFKILDSTAKIENIPVQYQASAGDGGTMADVVTNEVANLRIVNIGIPLRNMHCPVETINLADLESGIKLLTKFLINKKL